jgi:hypothetical protein
VEASLMICQIKEKNNRVMSDVNDSFTAWVLRDGEENL